MPRSFLRRNDSRRRFLNSAVVRERQRLVEDRREVAGVVGGADRGLVGDRLRRDQIAPAQPHRSMPVTRAASSTSRSSA